MLKNSILQSQFKSFKRAILVKNMKNEGLSLIYVVTNTNRHMLNKYLVTKTLIKKLTYHTTFGYIKSLCFQISLNQIPKELYNIPGTSLYSILCNNSFIAINK